MSAPARCRDIPRKPLTEPGHLNARKDRSAPGQPERGPSREVLRPTQIAPLQVVVGHGHLNQPLQTVVIAPAQLVPELLPDFMTRKEFALIEQPHAQLKSLVCQHQQSAGVLAVSADRPLGETR